MNFSRSLSPVLISIVLFSGGGCALIPVPLPRTIPDPIKRVHVIREDNNESIGNVEIAISASKFENWLRSFGPNYQSSFHSADADSMVISAQEILPGKFLLKQRTVMRKIKPWGLGPLGTTLHEDYAVTVSVRANGFYPMTATYWPTGKKNPTEDQNHDRLKSRAPSFNIDGTLTFQLRPTD